jgi:hypothetical protein
VAAAIVYVALATPPRPSHGPVLYDAFFPAPPYRWAHPPRDRANHNEPALPGGGVVPLGAYGLSLARVIQTGDAQMAVTFPAGVVAIQSGAQSITVTIAPLDPVEGPSAPAGLRFDGNAYRVQARYEPSGDDARLAGPVTLVIRYPRHGTAVLRSAGRGWDILPATRYPGTLQVRANSDALGVFAAAAPAASGNGWVVYAAAAGGIAIVGLGWFLYRRRRRPREGS